MNHILQEIEDLYKRPSGPVIITFPGSKMGDNMDLSFDATAFFCATSIKAST